VLRASKYQFIYLFICSLF